MAKNLDRLSEFLAQYANAIRGEKSALEALEMARHKQVTYRSYIVEMIGETAAAGLLGGVDVEA
jgi:hypothetical protein